MHRYGSRSGHGSYGEMLAGEVAAIERELFGALRRAEE